MNFADRQNFARVQHQAVMDLGIEGSEAYQLVGLMGPGQVPEAMDWMKRVLVTLNVRSGIDNGEDWVREQLIATLDSGLPSAEEFRQMKDRRQIERMEEGANDASALLCMFALPFPLIVPDENAEYFLATLVGAREMIRLTRS